MKQKHILVLTDDSFLVSAKSFLDSGKSYKTTLISLSEIESIGISSFVSRSVELCKSKKYDGVAATNDVVQVIASIIEEKSGSKKHAIKPVLNAANKYWSRNIQTKVASKATPEFFLASKTKNIDLSYPVFVKPTIGALSQYSFFARNKEELARNLAVNQKKAEKGLARKYAIFRSKFLCGYTDASFFDFICEKKVTGEQITVDGYCFEDTVCLFGATLSTFIPKTRSFRRFDYPREFSRILWKKIANITKKIVQAHGLRNMHFNIEYVIHRESQDIKIIEVNPRLSSQFAYLISTVYGYNPLMSMLDLAVNKNPDMENQRTQTPHEFCSCYVLRRESDAIVKKLPSKREIECLQKKYGYFDHVCLCYLGKKLSDYTQDPWTYRYGYITVPGKNRDEVYKRSEEIARALKYCFKPT